MSTRTQRDHARIRCLVAAINSLRCEIAQVVQAGEDPEQLNVYAEANFEKGDDGNTLTGLSRDDLAELIGSMAAMEKLIAMGHPAESVRALIAHGQGPIEGTMRLDLDLYLDGIVMDRSAEPAAEASRVEA